MTRPDAREALIQKVWDHCQTLSRSQCEEVADFIAAHGFKIDTRPTLDDLKKENSMLDEWGRNRRND